MNLNLKSQILRNILFALALLYFFSCTGQVKDTALVFPQIGWTLKIPKNSEILTSSQFDSLISATKGKSNINLELTNTELLFLIKKNEYNYFGSTISLFDSINFNSWEVAYSYYKQILVEAIESNKATISILDTSSSTEKIGGLIFQKYYIKTGYTNNNIILETYWYYIKHNNIEININIAFADKKIGKAYLALLRKSKFKR